jgi:NADPH-dependent 2,4-dienoyl-CoA reductase/sulfur reductase-like enzyme
MKRHELIVIGAGPAGLSAAIEAKKNGMDVIVFDENQRPGGQLFKQIHKFFGSKEHHAKTRGFIIGQQLLKEAEDLGVRVELDSTVMGIYENKEVTVKQNGEVHHYKGDAIIIATGAAENMIPFKGWNIPGVIGAGAAQTMMNIQGVQPGSKILMVGSGNVGLVVSFQLLQAGCEVAAIIDAAPRVGGYGVHAAKLARTGLPFPHRCGGKGHGSCYRCGDRTGGRALPAHSGNGKGTGRGYHLYCRWSDTNVPAGKQCHL